LIVVAEDHEDIRFVITRALERAGHEVVATADGAAAWEAVRRLRPDVVVTDMDMPRMTGLDLCRAIRADAGLRHIPVVLASGTVMPGDPAADLAGASAVLLSRSCRRNCSGASPRWSPGRTARRCRTDGPVGAALTDRSVPH
jgi:CheY-like chemotaxis protein